ncbi:MAG: retropepsin-like aspartic protease [Bacteroidetes bacterium]|nr:retropepsin-like aspartic protease [Bacteroidota bacterium]
MPKPHKIPLQAMPISDDGYHIFVEMEVNEHTVNMLLDTGASRTVFDSSKLKKIIKELALEVNEDRATGLGSDDVENFITEVKQIKIGKLTITDFQIGVLDLSHVNKSYKRMDIRPITGVLGSDILVKYGAIINFAEESLVFSK